jgi:biopolymer transport protein ExbD
MVNRTVVAFTTREAFANELLRAAAGNPDPVIIINADANATHQSVIHVMEAAQIAGFGKITFTAQLPR